MAFEDWVAEPLAITGIVMWVCTSLLGWILTFSGWSWDPDGWWALLLADDNMQLLWFIGPNCMVYSATQHLTKLEAVTGIIVIILIERLVVMLCLLSGFKKGRTTWQKDTFGGQSPEECAQNVADMECKNTYLQEMLDNSVIAKEDDDMIAYCIEPKSVYEDFACPPQQYILRFLGQMMLLSMLVYNIAYEPSSEAPPDPDEPFELIAGVKRADFFFWSSVIVQLMVVTQVGTSFDERCVWWLYMLSTKLNNVVLDRDPSGPDTEALGIRLRSTAFTVFPRFFFSFVVNGCCMDFIFLILPLLLMGAETPIDYVKDTFAVAYIVTLDNIDDERKYYFRKPAQLACWWGGYQQGAEQLAGTGARAPTSTQVVPQGAQADDEPAPTVVAEA